MRGIHGFICLVALAAPGCEGNPLRTKDEVPSPTYRPDPPKVAGPRIDAQPIPKDPPFVGAEGQDAAGYPRRLPDMAALLNLLRLQRFDTLETWMSYYQAAFERDQRKEDWPDLMVSAFFVADPELGDLLDAWVKRSPDHFAPWVARGNFRFKLAQHYRGGKYAAYTSLAQFRSMEALHLAAAKDFRRALELEPELVAAHRRLILMAKSTPEIAEGGTQGRSGSRSLLDAAIAICPLCYEVRASYLEDLTPRWGGSYDAMESYIREVQPLFEKNPRLALLSGMPAWDRCRTHDEDAPELAALECQQALAAGEDVRTLLSLAYVRKGMDQSDEALVALDRLLALQPQYRDALRLRYWLRIQKKDYLGAARDMITSRHLEPTDAATAKKLPWLVDMLRAEGDKLYRAGQREEAIPYFTAGLELSPDDHDLRHRAGWARREQGLDSLDAQLAASPDDFELRLQRDHALATQGKFAEVVAMWDEFISAHQDDPRAYSERAGAKWHMGRRDEGLADMQQACTLGLSEACRDADKMRARLPQAAP